MGLQIVVLAAGLGRRFGGDKQVAEVGPSGEWLLDYALYDARLAGFSEAVLVVRPEMAHLAQRPFPLPVKLAFQELPLGTAHAVWSAHTEVNGPFAVINADDFYGRKSYFQLADFLRSECDPRYYAIIGFPLKETLAESGPVSRAILNLDADGDLISLEEKVGLTTFSASFPPETLVSMNSWALDPGFLDFLGEKVPPFLRTKAEREELYLPFLIRQAMEERSVRVNVITAKARWMGITHVEDLRSVRSRIRALVEEGEYPIIQPE